MLLIPLFLLFISIVSTIAAWKMGFRKAILFVSILVALSFIAFFATKNMGGALSILGPFLLPFVIGASLFGLLAGQFIKNKRYTTASLLLAPVLLFTLNAALNHWDEKEIKRKGMEFINSEPRILKLLGEPIQAHLDVTAGGRKISQLQYSLNDRKSLYAIVDVKREGFSTSFRLACVTSLYIGQRDSALDVCAQGVVTLPTIP